MSHLRIVAKVKKTSFMGKPYYLLDYPQGRYLLTKSEYDKAPKKTITKDIKEVQVKDDFKGYYRYIQFVEKHPTFAKKVM
jgi:hypothetical protein